MFPSIRKKICKNTTELLTLDDIDEIPYKDLYFIFEPTTNDVYCFHSKSISQMKKNNKQDRKSWINPYTRCKTPINIINEQIKDQKIYKYYLLNKKLLKNTSNTQNTIIQTTSSITPTTSSRRRRYRRINAQNTIILDNNIQINLLNNIDTDTLNVLNTIQTEPELNQYINEQINEIFIEIDMLGNYTDMNWYNDMITNNVSGRRNLNRFCTELYDLWLRRLPFTNEIRLSYIPTMQDGNPFSCIYATSFRTLTQNFSRLNDITSRFVMMYILKQFIFSSEDREKRVQCAIYILGCLTIYSLPARNALHWLYETFV